MDFSSDTAHLFDDAKFGDECTKLDVKNRLETKHQNKREQRNYQFAAKILDRNSSMIKKDHEREMKSIKDGLQDIYVKTPYFETFWNLNHHKSDVFDVGDKIKEAVVNRILGRKPTLDIESVPEDRELEITEKKVVRQRRKETVRRTKSEPALPASPDTDSDKKRRLRCDSLNALYKDKPSSKALSNSTSTSCIFPQITDLHNSNKDLAKYTPVVIPKPRSKKRQSTSSVPQTEAEWSKSRSQAYIKKANYHVQTLDNIYMRRSLPLGQKQEEPEDPGFFYDELPENATLRAHFIAQANSRRRLCSEEKGLLSDINETFQTQG